MKTIGIFFSLLIAFLCCHPAITEAARTIDNVSAEEVKELGYKDKNELISMFTTCMVIRDNITTSSICATDNNRCIQSQPRWKANNCDYHGTSIYSLISDEQNAADRLFFDLPDAKVPEKKK